jgi:hypothetical protein
MFHLDLAMFHLFSFYAERKGDHSSLSFASLPSHTDHVTVYSCCISEKGVGVPQ